MVTLLLPGALTDVRIIDGLRINPKSGQKVDNSAQVDALREPSTHHRLPHCALPPSTCLRSSQISKPFMRGNHAVSRTVRQLHSVLSPRYEASQGHRSPNAGKGRTQITRWGISSPYHLACIERNHHLCLRSRTSRHGEPSPPLPTESTHPRMLKCWWSLCRINGLLCTECPVSGAPTSS